MEQHKRNLIHTSLVSGDDVMKTEEGGKRNGAGSIKRHMIGKGTTESAWTQSEQAVMLTNAIAVSKENANKQTFQAQQHFTEM